MSFYLLFTDILHIANLSLLSSTNLTILKLSVNCIDKICNLDSFQNLIELDLSHNRIEHIENLQVIRFLYVYIYFRMQIQYKGLLACGKSNLITFRKI